MSRRRAWLLALLAALLIAAGTMYFLKTQSDPGPGEPGGKGNVGVTLGAILILLLLAGASARRRRGAKGRTATMPDARRGRDAETAR